MNSLKLLRRAAAIAVVLLIGTLLVLSRRENAPATKHVSMSAASTLPTSAAVAKKTSPSTSEQRPRAVEEGIAPALASSDAGATSATSPRGIESAREREAERGEMHRAVPRPDDADNDESEEIEESLDSELARLTFPTGKMPKGDWRGKAMEHVRKNVKDGVPNGVSTFPRGKKNSNIAATRAINPDAVVNPTATWTLMGPKALDSTGTTNNAYQYGIVSGRMNALAFQPGSSSIAYAGAVVGGVWKTTNCCSSATTWSPLWDADDFPAQSVGAIAIDPVNTNIIYVGTGDSQVPASDMHSNGVFKSTDGGATWTQYGASVFSPYSSPGAPGASCCALAPDQNIKSLIIDPNNRNTIIAGASYGVFISRDAGVTWTQYDVKDRNNATYSASAQRVTSMLLDSSTNPSTLYVAIGYPYASTRRPGLIGGLNGVYKGTIPASGAPTFTLMANGFPAGTGSGTPNAVGRIELAWDATHTHIYAHVADYTSANVGMTLGIYHTADGGATWNVLTGTTEADFKDGCTGTGDESEQAWYDLSLDVDPLNDKTLYTGRTNLWKVTVDPTYKIATLTDLSNVYSQACPGYGKLHPDQHSFAFQPGSNPTRFLVGNDGGVYFGTGAVGGFTQLNGTINVNQFYGGQVGRDFANTSGTTQQWLSGGMQDNGNATWDSSQSTSQWIGRGTGGDGFHAAFDPIGGTLTAGRWIYEYTNGALSCSGTGADGPFASCKPNYGATERQDWSTPFIMDQWNCTAANCNNVVVGSTSPWASVNGGATWTKTTTTDITNGGNATVLSMNVAHSNPGSVIAGTSDGNVAWSSNVFTGANCTFAASNTATFACTVNTAANWAEINTSTLPARAVTGVVFDPLTNTKFYAAFSGFSINTPGKTGHIYMGSCSAAPCTAANTTWVDKSGNLPDIPFEGIQVNPNNVNQVFAGSYLGFYYTNDITATTPVWERYQTGMPNTRVSYLAVDRGVAASPRTSTTLAAFTYGRGVYVTKIDLPTCTAPGAPTVSTTASAANQITVSWSAGTPAPTTGYNVYRIAGSSCPSGTTGMTLLTATPLSAATTTYVDNTAVGGTTYTYVVEAVTSTCKTVSSCSTTIAWGDCVTRPTFAGLSSAANAAGGSCGVDLSWAAGASTCSSSVTYTIYRSTSSGFTPSVTNRVTSGVTGTTFQDTSALTPSTTYYYVVRATDAGNGLEDTNSVQRSATTGTCTSSPMQVLVFTVRSTGTSSAGSNLLEWVNPSFVQTGSSITINYRTDRYPTDVNDGTVILSNRAATQGAADSFTHSAITNGTTYYYGIWVRY